MEIIEVHWVDSCSTEGWTTETEDIAKIITVGILISKDKKQIKVGLSYDSNKKHHSWSGVIAIPLKCIIKYKFLRRKHESQDTRKYKKGAKRKGT